MYLIGDIGNTEVKICLFSNKSKLLKKLRISTQSLNQKNLNKNLRFLKNKKKNKKSAFLFSCTKSIHYY